MSSCNFTPPEDLLPIGYISKAKGLKGELKVFLYNKDSKSLKNDMDVWIDYSDSYKVYKLDYISLSGNNRVIKLQNIDSRELSENLVSKKIYISRKNFPDYKDFYLVDIIDFNVFDMEENKVGKVLDVINLPTNNSMLIKCKSKEIMIPIIDDFIELFDFNNKKIVIKNSKVFIEKC